MTKPARSYEELRSEIHELEDTVERLTESKRHFSALADAKGKENCALRQENERLTAALTGIAEFCSGDDRTLGAIARLAHVRNTAEQALRHHEQRADGEK